VADSLFVLSPLAPEPAKLWFGIILLAATALTGVLLAAGLLRRP